MTPLSAPPEAEPGPIFLAGIDRSGIGLLGEILETHPDVSMTRRTNFWSYYDGRFGPLDDRRNFDRSLDEMARNRRMQLFDPDRAQLWADLTSGPATYPRLFELMQQQLMQRRGRVRWGDKSLGAERYTSRILASYPTARIVHVIRDPRDRYASQLHHRGVGQGGVGAGAAMWRWSERLATHGERRLPDRYRVVRYEDLVARPDTVLDELGTFVDLVSDQPRSEPADLDASSIGRFRDDLSEADVAFLQLATRRGMARQGYQRVDGLCLGDSPLRTVGRQGVQMVGWQSMTGLRHRRGLEPSTRRLEHTDDHSRPREVEVM